GIKKRRLIDVRNVVRRVVEVPVNDPRVQQRVAEVGSGGGETDGERPREDDREHKKKSERSKLAGGASQRRYYRVIANARTGNESRPRTFGGTAKKRMSPSSGNESRFVRCS